MIKYCNVVKNKRMIRMSCVCSGQNILFPELYYFQGKIRKNSVGCLDLLTLATVV